MVTEGKTKLVIPITAARFQAKDDITAGDGKLHDVLPGKGALATRTTSNVFELLRYAGLPVAYIAQDSPTSFVGHLCEMFPLEVVVRREAHGSYLKRNPDQKKGNLFLYPLVELYLKTKGRRYGNLPLPYDDPLLIVEEKCVKLFYPSHPIEKPFAELSLKEVSGLENSHDIAELAVRAFLTLEKAWMLLGRRLVDMKVECGRLGADQESQILLADVIDNDSWRLLDPYGNYLDKQVYRDGGDTTAVLRNYEMIASLTDLFKGEFIRNSVSDLARMTKPQWFRRF